MEFCEDWERVRMYARSDISITKKGLRTVQSQDLSQLTLNATLDSEGPPPPWNLGIIINTRMSTMCLISPNTDVQEWLDLHAFRSVCMSVKSRFTFFLVLWSQWLEAARRASTANKLAATVNQILVYRVHYTV